MTASPKPYDPALPRSLPAPGSPTPERSPAIGVSDAKARLLLWAEGNDARQREARQKLRPVAVGGAAALVGGMLLGRALTPRRGYIPSPAGLITKLGSAAIGTVVMAKIRKMI